MEVNGNNENNENRREYNNGNMPGGTGLKNPYENNVDFSAVYQQGYMETPGKKKKGMGTGIVIGLAAGFLAAVLVFLAVVTAYTGVTGKYLVFGKGTVSSSKQSNILDDATVDKVNEIMQYIDAYYTGDVDEDVIQDALIHGAVDGLGDPYSVYYTKEEYEDLQVDTSGKYYGIGAGLSQNTETMIVTISKVYEGTPAEESGLKKGDIITYVNDVDATSMEVSDLVHLIRGEEGTTVHLTINRDGETLEFDVERKNITIPSIASQMLDDGMGYIQITEFQSETAEQFETAYEDLVSQGMQGLIVDVRANPGGYLNTVVDILDYILPEGLLVYTEDKEGQRVEYNSDASCIDIPMVVLVDENSASASEIFAGALKDYDYATLVGVTTFGKGIVQSLFPLSDGDAIKITTAKYYTPNGNYIHGVGITPDVEIEYEWLGPEDATEYDQQYDNQLQKAIEVLGDKMAEAGQ